jgi:RNA polymerase sigma factor (sigma-70 family)
MEPSDEALILACRRGDASAWEALVERYQRLIYTISRRAGLDEEQSADVFQRVFVALLEHLERIETPALIRSWLVTTTRHEAWRFGRRERGVQLLMGETTDLVETLADDTVLPEELMIRLEEQHQVRTAVAALEDRCHRLLVLLFYRPDVPSYTEVAAELGMSEGSVGPTRARCLRKLRHLLEKAGG